MNLAVETPENTSLDPFSRWSMRSLSTDPVRREPWVPLRDGDEIDDRKIGATMGK